MLTLNQKKWKEVIIICLSVSILFLLNILLNGWVEIKSLCLDDLNEWVIYHQSSSIQFIFNTEVGKFRPILNFVLLIIYKLIGINYQYFDIILLMLNFIFILIIYFILQKITNSYFVSLLISVMILSSRFAYYQVSQVFGIMEAMGLIFAVVIVYLLYKYLNSNNNKNNAYYFACIFYILACNTHERYIVLIGLIIITFLLKGRDKNEDSLFGALLPLFVASFIFISLIMLRVQFLGNIGLEGTSGTKIVDTFNLSQMVEYCYSQFIYLLGINYGPTYLNGINYLSVPNNIYILIGIYLVMYLSIFVLFINILIKDKVHRIKHIKNSIFFVTYIVLCILSSSITIRVEMRWIYSSLVGILFLMGYMLNCCMSNKQSTTLKHKKYFSTCYILLSLIMGVTFISTESFYRNNWTNLYYWGTQAFYNSLYKETIYKYGEGINNINLFIITKDTTTSLVESIDQYYTQYGFGPMNIWVVQSLPVVDFAKGNDIVLIQDMDNFKCFDITRYYVN